LRSKRGYGLTKEEEEEEEEEEAEEEAEEEEASDGHRPLFLKLETDGYPIRAIEGQVAAAQIALAGFHFSLRTPGSLTLPAILPDAISPAPDNKLYDRELSDVIGPPISPPLPPPPPPARVASLAIRRGRPGNKESIPGLPFHSNDKFLSSTINLSDVLVARDRERDRMTIIAANGG